MAEVPIAKGKELTKEVQEEIVKKLKELEENKAKAPPATGGAAAWSVNYTT